MGNMEYTGTNVLQVIAMIADDVEKRLMYLPEVEEMTIVCEDQRLRTPFVGKTVRVFNMNKATQAPEVLPLPEFNLLLAICAASLNIEQVQPNEGPSFKRIRKKFLVDTTYKKARSAFGRLSVVVNHLEPPFRAVVPDNDDDDSL